MNPDLHLFSSHVDELERTIDGLQFGDVIDIAKDGKPIAVLMHPDTFDDLIAKTGG